METWNYANEMVRKHAFAECCVGVQAGLGSEAWAELMRQLRVTAADVGGQGMKAMLGLLSESGRAQLAAPTTMPPHHPDLVLDALNGHMVEACQKLIVAAAVRFEAFAEKQLKAPAAAQLQALRHIKAIAATLEAAGVGGLGHLPPVTGAADTPLPSLAEAAAASAVWVPPAP